MAFLIVVCGLMERSKQTFINGKKDGDFEVTECTHWRATAKVSLFHIRYAWSVASRSKLGILFVLTGCNCHYHFIFQAWRGVFFIQDVYFV